MTAPQTAKQEEQPRRKPFRDWAGVVTVADRNAIPDSAFFHLENLQPIGPANLASVPDISASLHNYAADTIYWSRYTNIGGVNFLQNLSTNGKVFAYNIDTATSTQLSTALSGANSKIDQWRNQIALYIDSTGYYYWDGTTFAKLTGTGVPSAGTCIAVYAGRVWIANGRTIFFSGAGGFGGGTPTIPDGTNYWDPANGAGFVIVNDPQLRSSIKFLEARDGYLYYGDGGSVWIISDVYVPTGATPPTPVFSNLNLQNNLGTEHAGSVFSVNREFTFATKSGIWAVNGVLAARISADIDGTWKYFDPAQPFFGGAVTINNILTRAMVMKRLDDPIFGDDTILCMYWDNKWWFANYGDIKVAVPAVIGEDQRLYAFIGNNLYQLFADPTSAPAFEIMTKLWPMDDPIQDKQVIRAGFEAQFSVLIEPLTLNLDTVDGASTPVPAASSAGFVQWQNNAGSILPWEDTGLNTVEWFSGSFLLFWGSSPGGYSKYVGLSVTGRAIAKVSGFYMDYKLGASW